MVTTMKQLETELDTVKDRVKNLEKKLESEAGKKTYASSRVSQLTDSIVELKQNLNMLHTSLQERFKVIYEQLKK